MLCFVINLDRSPERLAAFRTQAEAAGLVVERLPGVDGGALSAADVAAALAPRFQFQPLSRGELGVFLSHKEAWRRLVDSESQMAAVFEDDAVLAPQLGELLANLDNQTLPFDVLKLETGLRAVAVHRQGHALGPRHVARELMSWHGGTAGYVITRAGAALLLTLTDPIADTVDQAMFHPFSTVRRQLRVGQAIPAPVIQRQRLPGTAAAAVVASTIATERRRRLFRYGFGRDLHRSARKVLEAIQLRLAGWRGSRQVVPFEGEA